jgi:hypothetical protein
VTDVFRDGIFNWVRNLTRPVLQVETGPGVWVTIGSDGVTSVEFPAEVVERLDVEPLVRPEDLLIEPMSITLYADSSAEPVDHDVIRTGADPAGYARGGVAWSVGATSWSALSGCDCPACEAMANPATSFEPTVKAVEDREAVWLEILARETEVCGSPLEAARRVFGQDPPR